MRAGFLGEDTEFDGCNDFRYFCSTEQKLQPSLQTHTGSPTSILG